MNPLITVWVTGAGGLIGAALASAASRRAGLRVVGLTRATVDLEDERRVAERFELDRPGCILHCAALSRTPDCEADPARARNVNVAVTARLASLDGAVKVVFLSSDLVFDGRLGSYRETDSANPISVYGRTKLEAESAVLATSRGLVIRTSLNYGRSPTRDRAFNEVMEAAWGRGETVTLFRDEFRSPIAAVETAEAVLDLAALDLRGVFHVAGSERLSRLACGERLAARHPRLNPRIQAASWRDRPGPPRAPDTTLDCAKAAAALGRELPRFGDWLSAQPLEE